MSTVSSEAASHEPREQDAASIPSLSLEADPSGLTERAPALASLLPDEALSLALARGDTHAVYSALTARLEQEPSGPARDTLQQLLAQRELFAVAERPPRLGDVLGTGIALVRLPARDKQQTPFVATRALRVLGVPLWPLSQHLVRRGRDGQLEVLGRVPAASSRGVFRALSMLGAAGVLVASLGAGLVPLGLREVHVVNGLSRTVQVQLGDRHVTLEPGAEAKERFFSLAAAYPIRARWPGETLPFEGVMVEDNPRAVYNVLGAASLQVDDPTEPDAPRPLAGRLASLESGEELVAWKSGWESTVRELADAGNWQQASEVAQAVALADPTATRAREEALRWTIRYKRAEAEAFIDRLVERYPEDVTVHHLAQDALAGMGKAGRSRKQYLNWATQAPDSAFRALLHARTLPPDEQPEAYADVLKRFPNSPEAKRELARLFLEDNAPEKALELLEEAPSSLEGVELRVRTLISLKRLRDASNTVRHYSNDPRHHSWELAVLAGRLDRLAGPTRAQYITHDLLPASLAQSPEHMVAFALLTGDNTVEDKELRTVMDPSAREALEIMRESTKGLKTATQRARTARDSVLNRLPMEVAAVLALELSRTGDAEGASRVFGSHLALWLAREQLEDFLRFGVESLYMSLLPPELHATAHLIRARGLKEGQRDEQDKARLVDMLGGFARRELDPNYSEYTPLTSYRPTYRPCRHRQIIEIIKGTPPPQ